MDKMQSILVIDDDKELCQLLDEYLHPEGFAVEAVYEPETGLKRAKSLDHTLVILDVMLPGMTGFELLQELRKTSKIPVLMLTARGEDIDRILGLEMGADDYLAKPFNPRELLARIHAICRRISSETGQRTEQQEPVELDDITINLKSRVVRQNNRNVEITAVEFDLLYELLIHAGQVKTREELTRKVLNRKLESFDRSIDVHISSLRKKFGNRIDSRERIKTIRSIGYIYTLDGREQ